MLRVTSRGGEAWWQGWRWRRATHEGGQRRRMVMMARVQWWWSVGRALEEEQGSVEAMIGSWCKGRWPVVDCRVMVGLAC